MSGLSSINDCQKTFNFIALNAALKTYLIMSVKQCLKNETYNVLTDVHLWRSLLVAVCITTLLAEEKALCISTYIV
jgi:hypothetical protein